ncbi:S-acyl fatty acid synthase thioesterase, medium chain [Hippopotamus amphibius kiboko]|uniref:S-acyl fatty acid synthase thioesterase, medium chain n=1 Tax=Hippopotamus amphibius kiboko TaxID=575201 RepID=UPI0025914448|nr:S-acyl fatty acid synthase thioesterase, medium chain [Hippopotamus amphibius kiboko]
MQTSVFQKQTRNKNVVNCLYHNRDALFRLVCFPWAGGNSYHFAKWGQNISSLVEVHAIRLAGRESQLQEPFPKDIYQVVDEVVCALLPVLQGENFAFFGHSLGSYLAFMTALHLKEKCKLEPVHLFVSGVNPPHSKARYCIPEESLSEEQITSQLKKPGGTPKDFFEDDTCLQFPRLLADVYLGSNYIFDTPSEVPLSCDLTCFTGSDDIPEDFKAWGDVTSGSCDTHVLPGNHFYLMEPSNEIFIKNYITKTLEASMIHYI